MKKVQLALITGAGAVATTPAFAHTGPHMFEGFLSGFVHPFMGLDHMAAMLAVGTWAAFVGTQAKRSLPLAFVLTMVVGALLALSAFSLPVVEAGIASSVLVLGLLLSFSIKLQTNVAAGLVALFALFHGFAHGSEIPAAASPVLYGLGFVAATLVLHIAGIQLGNRLQGTFGKVALRSAGGVIAIAGLSMLGAAV